MLPRKFREKSSFRFFTMSVFPVIIANICISIIISFPLFRYGNQQDSLVTLCINLVAFISHYLFLNFLVGTIIFLLSIIFPSRIIIFFEIALFSLFQVLLLIDTKIYSLFQYHLNSLVWNVITTEGVSDSVILGKGTVFTFLLWSAFILLAEIIINIKLVNHNLKPERLPLFIKVSRIIFVVFLCLIALDKGLYAYGDLYNKTEITKNAKLYPLYQPLTVKRFAMKVLHMRVNRETGFTITPSNSSLNYPKMQPVFDPGKNQNYNMLIIVLDGLRFDMLNKDVTPNLLAFAENNIIYANHYSGGNGTRFGIFSLLYGVHGSYWHTFLAQRRSPVLIDSLIDKGYDFKILSSTILTFPEFRKTAFIKIPGQIKDNFEGNTIPEKDELLTSEFMGYAASRKPQRPFFAFLYYNSSHEPFTYPDDFTRFQPVIKGEINYFKDIEKGKVPLLKNMYKNSVFYEDHLIGKVIASLKENRLLDNTIVVITGDHGEEFFENGTWGHTSSFNDYQLKTAFVMHYPGAGHRIIQRITSHLDLVPTLMESLGCVSPPDEYSQGFSLPGEKEHPYITAANWDTAAIIDNELKIVYSTELYNIGSFKVHKKSDYALIQDPGQLLKEKNGLLLDVLVKMSEFYKKM